MIRSPTRQRIIEWWAKDRNDGYGSREPIKMPDINIQYYKANDLIMAEYNPRQLTKDQYTQLKDSLTRFGLVDPLIVNKHKSRKNILVGGHQRLKIAKEMGMDKIPCVEVDLPLDQEKELNIRLNKNVGEWDYDSLANYFDVSELMEWGFTDNDLFQFDQNYGTDFELPDGDKEPFQQMTFTVSNEQAEVVENTIKKAKQNDFGNTGNENSNGNALWWICNSYE